MCVFRVQEWASVLQKHLVTLLNTLTGYHAINGVRESTYWDSNWWTSNEVLMKEKCSLYYLYIGSWDSMLVECRTHDWKVSSFSPGRRIFFSRVNFLCLLSFGVCSTPLLPQWHVKDTCHSSKSAGGRLHLNRHTSLTQWSWSELTVLSRHSVEPIRKN